MSAFERTARRRTVTTDELWTGTDPTPKVVSRTVVVSRYTVTGVEAVPMFENERPGARLYVPAWVTVHVADGAGPRVTVHGYIQRKDGSLGEKDYEIHRYSWAREKWPEWLREIVQDAEAVQA